MLPNDSLQPLPDDAGLDAIVDVPNVSKVQPMLVVGHFCYAKYDKDGRYYAARVKKVSSNGEKVTVDFRLLKSTATLPVLDVKSIAFQVDERCKVMHGGELTAANVVEIEDFENIKVRETFIGKETTTAVDSLYPLSLLSRCNLCPVRRRWFS